MKLDLELCRKILQKIENEGDVDGLGEFPSIENEDDHFVYYQIKRMREAGYVKGGVEGKSSTSEYKYFQIELTFQGHEFLRQMLDDTIWKKTQELAKKKGVELTFETVKAIIPMVLKSLFD